MLHLEKPVADQTFTKPQKITVIGASGVERASAKVPHPAYHHKTAALLLFFVAEQHVKQHSSMWCHHS
jgi:hypothetical protein